MLTRVAATCAVLLALTAAPAYATEPSGDPAASMYGPQTMVAIDLTLPPSSEAALEADPTGDYVPGTFSLARTDGTPGGIGAFSAPIQVGIRLKGKAGSFKPLGEKAAFKVKFSFVKGQRFLGLKKLTLNNMVQDPSMVHEALSYAAFRTMGVDASRTGYAFVRLNGRPLGVYLNVEDLDDVSLEKRFGPFDDPQHLYEGEYGTDARTEDVEDFEIDEGDKTVRSDLEALATAVEGSVPSDWSDRIGPYADLAEMTRMWAVEKYAGHWDGYAGKADDADHDLPNNFYLLSDRLGKFQMLPWGTDSTWEERVSFGSGGGLLFEGCRGDSSCAQFFADALGTALDTIPALRLSETARCTAELLAPWQALEATAIRPHDAAEIAAGVTAARAFATDRPSELAAWLGVAPPAPPAAGTCAWEVLDQSSIVPPLIPVEQDSTRSNREAPPERPVAPILRLARVTNSRGTMVARFEVSAPGNLALRATLRTRKRVLPVCAASGASAAAGELVVRCPLLRPIRQRLRARWLRLRLEAQLASPPAPAAHLSTSITLLRTASSNR